MNLLEILDKDIINIKLDAKNKDDALKQLASNLYQQNYIADIDSFVKDIYVREEEGMTGMGNAIAIPHGKSSSVKRVGISIAKLMNPIQWESIDGEPVSLIFLFCVSDDEDYSMNHMRLLAQLAGKLGNDERVSKLHKVNTKEELISVLCD